MSFCSSRVSNFLACLCVLTAAVTPAAWAFQGAQADPLVGLWGTEVRFGSPVQGDLTLDARGGVWRAFIAGYQVEVHVKGNDIGFTLPGNIAEFRGHKNEAATDVHGQWIQQSGDILNQQFASPVQLHSIATSVWRGTIVPLDQRISVYAFLSSSDGKLTAFLSNPEMNFFRRRVFMVTRDGTKIQMEAKGSKIEGTYDDKSDTLSLRLVNFLPPFQFTRRKERDAVGFYPRISSDSTEWQYRKPLPENDGWTTASLEAVGLNEQPIAALVHRILAADSSVNPIAIQSLLIARHGHLVAEEYFYGFDKERTHDMRSAAKTFAPVLAGLAREHGAQLSPKTPIYPLFSRYSSFANWDARKAKVTLRDIMTMTAGNACDDNDDDSPGNEDRMQGDSQIHDWYKYSLDLPMLKGPGGEDATYCSADLNLVGGVVAAATNSWLPEFFEQSLARPLQFGRYYLNLMPDGQAYMGGGAYVRPRDQLKLGQLYLAGGIWNGKRVVSQEWVSDSTSFHSRFAPANSLGQEHEYGYGWHIHDLKSGGRIYREFSAEGNGGQLVIVIPELDVVVGITGGNYGEFDKWGRWELELVPQFIIPAASRTQGH
jgi:CubicO group peptidase (beta-lactamase class C family)